MFDYTIVNNRLRAVLDFSVPVLCQNVTSMFCFCSFQGGWVHDLPGVRGLYFWHLRNWSVNIRNLAGMVMTKIKGWLSRALLGELGACLGRGFQQSLLEGAIVRRSPWKWDDFTYCFV